MANRTDPLARVVHGTNPQNLIEAILRQKIYGCLYWKEKCFGLTAESLVDHAVELRTYGGTLGGSLKPTDFVCLVLKMLQIQPDKDIVVEFIKNEDYKYVRLLGAFYLRLVGKPAEVFQYLEPLYNDYRKVRLQRHDGGYELKHIDEFIEELLTKDYSLDIALPRLPKRWTLEATGALEPRMSALEEDFEEAMLREEQAAEEHQKQLQQQQQEELKAKEQQQAKRERERERERDRDRDRTRREREDERERDRGRDRDRDRSGDRARDRGRDRGYRDDSRERRRERGTDRYQSRGRDRDDGGDRDDSRERRRERGRDSYRSRGRDRDEREDEHRRRRRRDDDDDYRGRDDGYRRRDRERSLSPPRRRRGRKSRSPSLSPSPSRSRSRSPVRKQKKAAPEDGKRDKKPAKKAKATADGMTAEEQEIAEANALRARLGLKPLR
mmetsp:Transcript_2890/g.10460  ORF Transcript_2890/g.10460 Transcript_2890/m.10460 type:complete len:440 (-) Transcript_2890:2120-3439(-)